MLLSWVDDDSGVPREIKGLRHLFEDLYNLQVQEHRIPSSKAVQALMRRVLDVLEDNLLRVYYGRRHGRRANEASLQFA